MRDFSPRYSVPVAISRPRGARLIEGFSPKLKRRVHLFDHLAFSLWIGLEADPRVICLCERPARTGPNAYDPVMDFWVLRADAEEFLMLSRDASNNTQPAPVDGIVVRHVDAAERAASDVWVSNWKRMLPVINATRDVIPKSLMKSVRDFVRQPMALAVVEHEFSCGDPMIARGAIFEMLRRGELVAPSLRLGSLGLYTMLEPST